MSVEVGDIWYRNVGTNGDYLIAYYLILKIGRSPYPTMPWEYRMLPLTPHLDKTSIFQYENPLNHWHNWERAA